MKKILSYLFRAVIVAAAIFVLAWIFFFVYLTLNKNKIISKIKVQLNQQVRGNLSIGDLVPDFLHAFPFPAIKISNVVIRDSLWQQHHHDFLEAQKIYVRLNPLSLFNQKPSAGKITIENATIFFYTDSVGHSNLVKTAATNSNNSNRDTPDLQFVNTRFVLQDENKHKFHDIFCEKLKLDIDKKGDETKLKIKIKGLVHSLSFNTDKGSYLQEKSLEGKFELLMRNKNSLEFKNIDLDIGGHSFYLTGKFLFDLRQEFNLSIETKKISYEKVQALLPFLIRQQLKNYSVNTPLSIRANLSGSLAYGSVPWVTIDLESKRSHVITPVAEFTDCNVTANYNNRVVKESEPSDPNSKIIFKNFSGRWEDILLKADAIVISNLARPVISCDVRSTFDLKKLNDLTGSNTMQFTTGSADMAIHYRSSLVTDSIPPAIDGHIEMKNAELNYVPRHFSLRNCKGTVVFQNHDVFIKKLSATAGDNQLVMNGSVNNFLSLLNTPENLTINWNIYSPVLDINNFISYLGKRSATPISNSKKKFFWIADRIDRMLKDGTADLQIQASRVTYKKFTAKNISASIQLLNNKIILSNAKLSHAGGSMSLSGSLTDQVYSNALNFSAQLERVNIPEVFHSFNNFGQDAITEKNMQGILSANIVGSLGLTDQAAIISNSMTAKVDFNIENGELINFEPAQKISEVAFKKRDFTNLHFAELKNNLIVNGSAITIPNMEIHSNVLSMFVQGVYDVKKGTDMSIRVPVSNLKKPDQDAVVKNKNKAGLSIRLRAKTQEDGTLKVTWDPFNKSAKSNMNSKTSAVQQN